MNTTPLLGTSEKKNNQFVEWGSFLDYYKPDSVQIISRSPLCGEHINSSLFILRLSADLRETKREK